MSSAQNIHGFVRLSPGVRPAGLFHRMAVRYRDHGQGLAAEYLGNTPTSRSEELSSSLVPQPVLKEHENDFLPSPGYASRLIPSHPGDVLVSRLQPATRCDYINGTSELSRSLKYVLDVQLDGTLNTSAILGILNVLRTSSMGDLCAKLEPFGIEVRGFKGMPYSKKDLFRRYRGERCAFYGDYAYLKELSEGGTQFLDANLSCIARDTNPVTAANLLNTWQPEVQLRAAKAGPLTFQVHALRLHGGTLTEKELINIFLGNTNTCTHLLPLPGCGRELLLSMADHSLYLANDDITDILNHPLADNEIFLLRMFDVLFAEYERLASLSGTIHADSQMFVKIRNAFIGMAHLKYPPFERLFDLNIDELQYAIAHNPDAPRNILEKLIDWAKRYDCLCMLMVLSNLPALADRRESILASLRTMASADEERPGEITKN